MAAFHTALELVGMWEGSNCGINDAKPQLAQLEMYPNGTNAWIFDGVRQTGLGYEAVVGWQCIGVGRGYWWGMVRYSNVTWCNLFQVSQDEETGDVGYINYAYGGEGVGALSQGSCPVDLATDAGDLSPLQASFVRVTGPPSNGLTNNETAAVMMTCNVPAGGEQLQPSCNPQFGGNYTAGGVGPDPFESGDSLPAIDPDTCLSIDARTYCSEFPNPNNSTVPMVSPREFD